MTQTPADIRKLFSDAFRHHQAGRVDDAERLYRQVLALDGRHADSLNWLGVVAFQRGNFPVAADLITKAIAIQEGVAAYHYYLGLALERLGKVPEAVARFERAVTLKPDFVEAYASLAGAFMALGRLEDAAGTYRRMLALKPDFAEALANLGSVLKLQGKTDEAVKHFQRALALKPKDPLTHYNLALALQRSNREEAVRHYREAVLLKPDFAEAHCNLGGLLQEQNLVDAAIDSFERAAALQPNNAGFRYNLGLALQRRGRFAEALAQYDQALALQPSHAEALNGRGTALIELGRFAEASVSYAQALAFKPNDPTLHYNAGVGLWREGKVEEALQRYDRALALKPDYVEALTNRGVALVALDRLEEALGCYERALALKPNHTEALNNRGNALLELKQLDAAQASYGAALEARPDLVESHWGQCLCALLAGDFGRGWEKHEWRWRKQPGISLARNFAQTLWLGEGAIADKTILLHAEQGLGDTIQFCRYAALLAARGARVLLEVPASLIPLLSEVNGVTRVIARGEPLPDFDMHCPLLSLPLACRTMLETVPAQVPYLTPAPDRLEHWRTRLGEARAPRIGLTWVGRSDHPNDRHRSLAPALLTPLLDVDATFVSLQKTLRPEDRAWLIDHPQVLQFADELDDFTDTAALANLMDLVITVDTSIAHLAGALARPVWILLPYVGLDFRWLLHRDDSPWYPTARLYRQPGISRWPEVIDRVTSDLRTLARQNA